MQVERIREIEVGEARLAEASRWRKELRKERAELERLYGERVARLRAREDAAAAAAAEARREGERRAFEQRQAALAEDERLRALQNVRQLEFISHLLLWTR